MNVEIEAEAAQFSEKEYINGIAPSTASPPPPPYTPPFLYELEDKLEAFQGLTELNQEVGKRGGGFHEIQIYINKKRKPADYSLIGRDYEDKSENLAASHPEIEASSCHTRRFPLPPPPLKVRSLAQGLTMLIGVRVISLRVGTG